MAMLPREWLRIRAVGLALGVAGAAIGMRAMANVLFGRSVGRSGATRQTSAGRRAVLPARDRDKGRTPGARGGEDCPSLLQDGQPLEPPAEPRATENGDGQF
jgi:hypothetical protein